jgi:hypothetical protein
MSLEKDKFAKHQAVVFERCAALRKAGQAEYAHAADNTFDNFERLGDALVLPREKVLLVYLAKHLDGITSWVNGHRSQREEVTGRIEDAIVYLTILHAMASELEREK